MNPEFYIGVLVRSIYHDITGIVVTNPTRVGITNVGPRTCVDVMWSDGTCRQTALEYLESV